MAKNSGTESSGTNEEHEGWSTKTRVILALVGIATFLVMYLIAVNLLPRTWTNFIAGMTNESVTTSWLLGLIVGFAFALIPILVFLMGMRLRKSWKGVIGWLIAAVATALPNIMTVAVSTGDSRTEQSAFTKMTNEAPGFITASYIGIALGILVGGWVAWVTYSRRRAKRKTAELEAKHEQQQAELAQQQAAEAQRAQQQAMQQAAQSAPDAPAAPGADEMADNVGTATTEAYGSDASASDASEFKAPE